MIGRVYRPAPLNRQHPLAVGLVSWWLALPHWSAGATWYDIAGGRNNGAITPGTGGWTGRFKPGQLSGSLLNFDGSTSKVTVADNANLKGMAALTISGWMYPRTTGGGAFGRMVSKNETTDYLVLINSATDIAGYVGGTAGFSASGASFLNAWSMFTLAYDGANITMYVNKTAGTPVAKTGAVPSSTNALYIGSRLAAGREFDGYIDDVKLWNRALPQKEINGLYSIGQVGYPGLIRRTRSTVFGVTATTTILSRKTLSSLGTGVGRRQTMPMNAAGGI